MRESKPRLYEVILCLAGGLASLGLGAYLLAHVFAAGITFELPQVSLSTPRFASAALSGWSPWATFAGFVLFMLWLIRSVKAPGREAPAQKDTPEKKTFLNAVKSAATNVASRPALKKESAPAPKFDPRRIAAMEQALGGIIVQNKLWVDVVQDVDGPQVITWVLKLTRNHTSGLATIKKLADPIAMAMGVQSVRITLDSGNILVEAPKPREACWTPNGAKLARASSQHEIIVGVDSWGKPRAIKPRTHGAIMWVGGSQRGKTQSLLSALLAILIQHEHARFMVLCQEGKRVEDWGILEGVRGNLGIVTDYHEMVDAMRWIEEDCRERRHKAGPTIIIVDDVTALPTDTIGPIMGEIAVTGAAYGYSLWLGTHMLGSNDATGSRKVEGVATAKLLFQMGSGNVASGAGKLETTGIMGLSSNPGDAILEDNGTYTRVATAYLPKGAFAHLNRGKAALFPWRGEEERNHPEPVPARVEPVPRAGTTPEPPGTTWNHPGTTPNASTVKPILGGGSPSGTSSGLPYQGRKWTYFIEEGLTTFPIEEARELSPTEAEEASALLQQGLSKNQLYKLIFAKPAPQGGYTEGKKGRTTKPILEQALKGINHHD